MSPPALLAVLQIDVALFKMLTAGYRDVILLKSRQQDIYSLFQLHVVSLLLFQ